ncbi:ABC transporter permease [Catellatospora methionotrophica]|uniref:ABC transporter permease n=1 Tax=Catellatospora methionotrophica TaxID=121620 RepID=UPI0033F2C50E
MDSTTPVPGSKLSRLSAVAAMVFIAVKLQLRSERGSPAALIIGVVQPVVFITVTTQVESGRDDQVNTGLVIGVGLLAVWGATVWTAGAILRWEAIGGTLAANVTGMWSPALVLFGKSLGATIRNTATVVVSVAVSVAVLRVHVPMRHPWWFIAGVVGVLVSGVALGMLLSCIFLLTRHGEAVASALMYALFILGGVAIPVSFLPTQIAWLSQLVSLRWAQELLVQASSGTPNAYTLGALFGLAAAYGVAAVALLSLIVNRARRRGTLELA